jgi:hypothetical protein
MKPSRQVSGAGLNESTTLLTMRTLLGVVLALVSLAAAAILMAGVLFRDRRPPVYFAAQRGDTNYVARYLGSGGGVNQGIICYYAGHRYAPLLDIAIEGGQLGTVDFLLNKGANPNRLDSSGRSPLMWAIGRSTREETGLEVIRTLLRAGADPNLADSPANYNYTPILEAALLGQPEMVAALLAAGANVNATNSVGQTALHLASDARVAKLLVAAGANLNARYIYVMPADRDHPAPVTHVETPAESALREQRLDVLAVLTNAPSRTNAAGARP